MKFTNSIIFLAFFLKSFYVNAASQRQLMPSSRCTGLIISEIMYHPVSQTNGSDLEFIELFNTEPVDYDISGYRLSGEINYTFPKGTKLTSRSFLVVAKDPEAMQTYYGLSTVSGPFINKLSNGGGTVRLVNNLGAVLWEVDYSDDPPWPAEADGAGHSLILARPDFGENNVKAWTASDEIGGNPGEIDYADHDLIYGVLINEILAIPAGGQTAFIEFYNYSPSVVDISGYFLTDNPDELDFKIPPGSTISPTGFLSFESTSWSPNLGLSPTGGVVYLFNSITNRVISAVKYKTQEIGISIGRNQEGSANFIALDSSTPNSYNSKLLARDIVINEIMYNPVFPGTDLEYVEIYNRSTSSVDVSDWQFTDGIDFVFPAYTVIPPSGFLVVANNRDLLISCYANLNRTNTFGNYSGKLSNSGERIRLVNYYGVIIDEVTYDDNGAWGKWTDGGGSSLELKDTHSDNSLAANWSGSDETSKGQWTTISHTGVLDHGVTAADELHLLLLDEGECLVDDASVIREGQSNNRVSNNDFESGLAGWVIEGNHILSELKTDEGYGSSQSLHLIAEGDGDTGANRVETDLTSQLNSGEIATLEVKARWLCGNRNLLLRLHGNYLEAVGTLNVPTNLGTPGAVNSAYNSNSAPAIFDVSHSPVLPASSETVTVSARINDTDNISSATLFYRIDPSLIYQPVIMKDDGTGADEISSDGIFHANIPGRSSGALVAFYVSAEDSNAIPEISRFPESSGKECLVMFGDPLPGGVYGSYKIWLTSANLTEWTTRRKMSNHLIDSTFAYGDFRVIYNTGIRYRGSPWIRPNYSDPVSSLCAYVIKIPKNEKLLGATAFNMDGLEQLFNRDNTLLREKMSFWTASQIGVPSSNMRFVNLYINRTKKGVIYSDSQHPNGDFVYSWFSYDPDGELFEIDDWFEFNDLVGFESVINGTIQNFVTTGGKKKKARYRWSWEKKVANADDDDYSKLFNLVDVMNATENYADTVGKIVDFDQWMRVFSVRRAVADWDGYSYARGKNAFIYKPEAGKWKQLLWDLDFSLGGGSDAYNFGLFDNINDPVLNNRFFQNPEVRRAFWRALKDIADGPFKSSNFNPVIDAYYFAFTSNGIYPANPGIVKTWVASRRNYILQQLQTVAVDFEITTAAGTNFATSESVVSIEGRAPVSVVKIKINGHFYPVDWTSETTWKIDVGLYPGDNALTFQGCDGKNTIMPGTNDFIRVTLTSSNQFHSPAVIINEIMYHPAASDAEFIELHNSSSYYPATLSNFRLEGVTYYFRPDAALGPNGYLVVAENSIGFSEAYGFEIPIEGEFSGTLNNAGETLRLIDYDDKTVDTVTYNDSFPWPDEADGTGPSLQLINQDSHNNRAANWAVSTFIKYTPNEPNAFDSSESSPPELWINELQNNNGSFIADNNGDFDPWIELVNFAPLTISSLSVTCVPANIEWKYLDNGSDQGNAWHAISFNDSSWASGNAQLGYGDGDEATIVSYGPDSNNKYATTYFRHYFIVSNVSSFSSLSLGLVRDDGAVIYLNGTEIRRDNMNSGEVNYNDFASTLIAGTDESTFFTTSVDPNLLNEGTNVLAVEIHQISGTSSDISFNLFLTASVPQNQFSLENFYLTDDYNDLTKWPFPTNASIQSDNYMVVWVDGEPGETTPIEFHTSFSLNNSSGLIALVHYSKVIDYINYEFIPYDYSFGDYPDGDPDGRMIFSVATPGSSNSNSSPIESVMIFINEWMADNDSFIEDPADIAAGASDPYDDWFELYNPGTQQISLTDYVLSDGNEDWTIPSGFTMSSNSFVIVWADNDIDQNGFTNQLHAGFKLSKDGESIILRAPDGQMIDRVNFGLQNSNISEGKWPDGNDNILQLYPPTPGATNEIPEPGALWIVTALVALLRKRTTLFFKPPAQGRWDKTQCY